MKKYFELLTDRFLLMITAIIMILLAWLFWSSSGQSIFFEIFILIAITLLVAENVHLRLRIKTLKQNNNSN
ncbi:hypothetical protein H0A36_06900 [Endozoicomonas sp. SM1973]|uniref:Uncharacterized protein n=1 Tax=Spartinivicinus marinus TaxID=2994442 RepID=A0A853IE55_9GAMM|nr:hypothetical protein [Spartinivicinus marinus]MCX4025743.1 hypothetical protein [Spartinivicinus marinus]NYZ65736.1 hypothetical protein [Spartinivicinus marinus]